MTSARIFKSDRPTLRFGRILPMSKQDRELNRIIAERLSHKDKAHG